MERKRTAALFSYRTERGAARTLKELRERLGPTGTTVKLVLRSDWRFYIQATTAEGRTGLVQKRPLWRIGTAIQGGAGLG
jgi:hypothetical protein